MRELLTLAAQNSLGAGILALLAIIASLLIRRPALTHILWVLVLVKLITPPIWVIPVKIGREEPEKVSTIDAPRSDVIDSRPVLSDFAINSVERVEPTVALPHVPAAKPRRASWETTVTAVGAFWICGSVIFATIAFVRLRRLSKLLRFAVDVPPDVRTRADHLANRLALRGAPRVAFIPAPISPMLLGFPIPARLLIPRRLWDQLTDSQRDALLLHELAHYRRRDHWVRSLELLVTLIHWWNPLTWLARRQLRIAEELCCDAWVTWALPQHADDYAAALVEAIDFAASRPGLPLLASGVGEFEHLQRRLLMIRSRQGNRKMGWTALVACAAIGVLPLSLTRARQEALLDRNDRPTTREAAPNSSNDPEAFLIFRGASSDAKGVEIFIEDVRDNHTVALHLGDTVDTTGGKIADLTVDADNTYILDYVRRDGSKRAHIRLGSSLATGQDVPALSAKDARTLVRAIPGIKFDQFKLGPALEFLHKAGQVKISVDWASLKIAGIDPDTRVSAQLKTVEFRQAIEFLLKSVKDDQAALRAVMDHGVVTVTTQGHLHMDQRPKDAVLLVGPLPPDPQTVATLSRMLPEVTFDQTGFGDVIDFLSDVTGLNLVVDWRSMQGSGLNRNSPLTTIIQHATASQALDTVLANLMANIGKGEKLHYSVDGRVIVISRVDRRGVMTLTLDARKSMEVGKYQEAMEAVNRILALDPTDEWASGVRPLLQDRVNVQAQRAALEQRFFPKDQITTQPSADAVARLRRQLEINTKLEKQWPSMTFNHEHFADVLDLFSKDIDVKFVVDWEALRKAGIFPETDIEFAMAGPVSRFLSTVLDQAGAGKAKLAYRVDPERGVIVIAIASEPATKPAANSLPNAEDADRRVEVQLQGTWPDMAFDQTGFGDVIDFLRDVTGLTIVVEWKALEAAKIDRNSPVTIKFHNIKASKAIDLILANLGGNPPQLGYTIRDGALVISTQNELAKDTLNRIYDVRDLINDANGKPDDQLKAKLIQEIRSSIDRNSWIDNGGHVGALRELSGQLVITQTRENQRKIMDFLEARRTELRAAGRGPATQRRIRFSIRGAEFYLG